MAAQNFWTIYDNSGGENDSMIWIIGIGILSGMISGMVIGGGTILIPVLLFLQDMTQQQAQGINLIYFVPTALIAIFTHIKNKKVELKIVKPITLVGLLGAAAGAFLAVKMDASLLRKFFGGFLLIMGLSELYKSKNKKAEGSKKRMNEIQFANVKAEFQKADLEGKIRIYVTTEGLSTKQYKELLGMYPIGQLDELEKALT